MEIKEQIEQLVKKLTADGSLKEIFQKDPVKAVEKLIGKDLPDDAVNKIVSGVKAKLSMDSISDAAGALKKLF